MRKRKANVILSGAKDLSATLRSFADGQFAPQSRDICPCLKPVREASFGRERVASLSRPKDGSRTGFRPVLQCRVDSGSSNRVTIPVGRTIAESAPADIRMPGNVQMGDNRLMLWDAAIGAVSADAITRRPVKAIAFAPDGKTLAAGDESGRIRVVSVPGGAVRLVFIDVPSDTKAAPTGWVVRDQSGAWRKSATTPGAR